MSAGNFCSFQSFRSFRGFFIQRSTSCFLVQFFNVRLSFDMTQPLCIGFQCFVNSVCLLACVMLIESERSSVSKVERGRFGKIGFDSCVRPGVVYIQAPPVTVISWGV